jgi:hypothetical protein
MILVSWRPLGHRVLCFHAKRSKSLHHTGDVGGMGGWGVMGVQYPEWDGRAPRKDPVNRFMRVLNRM